MKNRKEGKIRDVDLVLLNLQVCLASDSRHMSTACLKGRALSALGPLALGTR